MDDDDDDFYDTLSVNSQLVGRRRVNSRDYISLSRNTVYHSALDLEMELASLKQPTSDDEQPPPTTTTTTTSVPNSKVSKKNRTPIITYTQWRERV